MPTAGREPLCMWDQSGENEQGFYQEYGGCLNKIWALTGLKLKTVFPKSILLNVEDVIEDRGLERKFLKSKVKILYVLWCVLDRHLQNK